MPTLHINGQLVTDIELNGVSVLRINDARDGTLLYEKAIDYLCFTAGEANSTVGYTSTLATAPTIYKSTDGVNWTQWDGTAVTLSNVGDKLYLYGDNNTLGTSSDNYVNFTMTGSIAASGDVTTLLTRKGTTTLSYDRTFFGLFRDCTSLSSAPNLPATTLSNRCYANMFRGCTSLTAAPSLPATTLDEWCYGYMFDGCTSLTTVPTVLPATTLEPQCYYCMFSNCTSLVTPPVIPATTTATECCRRMFYLCSSLATAPALPATTLEESCYLQMLSGCTSLTTAPALPATTIAANCYYGMFEGCTSLTTGPATLPATTLASACYKYMFSGCTVLTAAPSLPATTLADDCYYQMFYNCTTLTSAPALPATTLASACYRNMFYNCTGITEAPYLPATTLATECYRAMFYNCSSLNFIQVEATSWNTTNAQNWVYGVAATGTFVKPSATDIPVGYSGIPSGWVVTAPDYLCFTAGQSNSTVAYTPGQNTTPTVYKSTDGTNWTQWDGTAVTLANVGDKMYLYGTNTVQSNTRLLKFTMTGSIAASGNVTTLLAKNGTDTIPPYAFHGMFSQCTSLTSAPDIPASTVGEAGCSEMFFRCSNLVTAPALPATTIGRTCYDMMFYECTSLATPPQVLPATTLMVGCYESMFTRCTSMTSTPELKGTSLVSNCYKNLFDGCTNISSVKMAIQTWDTLKAMNWLNGVAASGVIHAPAGSDIASYSGSNGVPSGWTVSYYQ